MRRTHTTRRGLAERFRSAFPTRIRKRGNEYWRDGRIELYEASAHLFTALVFGTGDYEVDLEWNATDGVLAASCTCPYLIDREKLCKHVWTALLEADQTVCLSSAKGATRARIEPLIPSDLENSAFDFETLPEEAGAVLPYGPPMDLPTRQSRAPQYVTNWQEHLHSVRTNEEVVEHIDNAWLTDQRQLLYAVSLDPALADSGVVVELFHRDRKKNGDWGALKRPVPRVATIERLPELVDRQLLNAVVGAARHYGGNVSSYFSYDVPHAFVLARSMQAQWIELAAGTGRLVRVEEGAQEVIPLSWDAGPPWCLAVEVTRTDEQFELRGRLVRENERVPLTDPSVVVSQGVVLRGDRLAPLSDAATEAWTRMLTSVGTVRVPRAEQAAFVETLLELPRPTELVVPDELSYETVVGDPEPRLSIGAAEDWWLSDRHLLPAELSFEYEGVRLPAESPRSSVYIAEKSLVVERSPDAEQRALNRLIELGVRRESQSYAYDTPRLVVAEKRLTAIVHALTHEGWFVEAEGSTYRRALAVNLRVSSEIDWFNLAGEIDFGETTAELPELLRALRAGTKTLQLADGSTGLLPEEWLSRYGTVVSMGEASEKGIRFGRHQIGALDALLAEEPEISQDRAVAQARRRLERFSGVRPKAAPRGFHGELRDYQQRGLGWLHALRQIGFGACLADDMGLGKTIQILALLESRRAKRHRRSTPEVDRPGPSLVVVPKSLVFNWLREAERFTPKLQILEYTGTQRRTVRSRFAEYDVILTTYGILRRDVAELRKHTFDYVVLDEAQAIKNAKSKTAKTARLLRASHRVAMTGTPVENHVRELMSLLDFLNPGLFGQGQQVRIPRAALEGARSGPSESEEQTLRWIGAMARPFILRRTKSQVAKDLPEKVENTLYCELLPKQRKSYDELLEHYRRSLLGKIENGGLGRSKIHVLEALLRLRQAACHPGLIDATRVGERSSKLDVLLQQISDARENGHRALVFSQFTSLLAIVRSHLDEQGVVYEYLDGRTRSRQARVDRFQSDPECSVFLISLKAGGVGLNLTAAEYVFLLDPWWNPAVEAQAIDRTHRIGQTRSVFAYSLIARNTIEEKVLALQKAKRAMAESVVHAGEGFLKSLTREELLELLA